MLTIQNGNRNLLREPRYRRNGWIGVDLDGTLAECVSGQDPFTIGAPVPLMYQRVLYWVRTGRTVKIFTARAGDEKQRRLIEQWCKYHGLPKLEITDRKDFGMLALWDDRAVGVVPNMGIPILAQRLSFWQRLRLSLAVFFRGNAKVASDQDQLLDHISAAVEHSRMLLEPPATHYRASSSDLPLATFRVMKRTDNSLSQN